MKRTTEWRLPLGTLALAVTALVCLMLAACYRRPPELDRMLARGETNSSQQRDTGAGATGTAHARESKRPKARPAKSASSDRPGRGGSKTAGATKRSGSDAAAKPAKRRRKIPRIILRRHRQPTSPEPTPQLPGDADRAATEPVASAGESVQRNGTEKGDVPAEEAADGREQTVDWKDYISVEELRQELQFLLEQVELKLRTRKDFDRYFRELEGDAAVLGILAVILQEHPDADRKLRRVARTLAELAMDLQLAASERSAENYEEAKMAYEEAAALLSGQSSGEAGEPVTWEDVASLGDLMARIETGFKRIRGGVNTPTFDKDNYLFAHEAKLLAILSRVSSFYRSNEPTYVKYARDMEQWALKAAEASRRKDRDQARKAVSQLNRICNQCHRAFRLERGTGNSLDF